MSAADNNHNPFPPWPQARVDLASYAAPGTPERAAADAAALREQRLLDKMARARARLQQVMNCLSSDAYGTPREPSLEEREALEDLRQVLEELMP